MVLRRQEDFAKEPRHIRHSSRRLRSGLPTVQGLRSAGVRFAHSDGYANGCTIGFYRCHAYANYNADVNDNADVDTRSGESLCHAKTCSGEYFYCQRRSNKRSSK